MQFSELAETKLQNIWTACSFITEILGSNMLDFVGTQDSAKNPIKSEGLFLE